jgi:hypothetical protein
LSSDHDKDLGVQECGLTFAIQTSPFSHYKFIKMEYLKIGRLAQKLLRIMLHALSHPSQLMRQLAQSCLAVNLLPCETPGFGLTTLKEN